MSLSIEELDRAAFEKWSRAHALLHNGPYALRLFTCYTRDRDGKYDLQQLQQLWECWQAAMTSTGMY